MKAVTDETFMFRLFCPRPRGRKTFCSCDRNNIQASARKTLCWRRVCLKWLLVLKNEPCSNPIQMPAIYQTYGLDILSFKSKVQHKFQR
ncbi:hypothetical protein H6F53_22185 [Trichocoleus sp. FACHB-832]|nr:hypothetical protein [Trichocoleus sp. FACHB-832]